MNTVFSSALRAGLLAAIALAPVPVAAAPNDAIADRVLGQADLTTAARNFVDARGLGRAAGIAIDKSVVPNRLYAADGANSRVLVWFDAAGFQNGEAADAVIGQADFFSNQCNQGGLDALSLCAPDSVAVDPAGNLFVADTGNSRVLQFNAPLSTDRVADRVFGQVDFHSAIRCAPASAASLCDPLVVALDAAGNLYVADFQRARVLEFDAPLTSDAVADRVFGQPDFTTGVCRPEADPLTTLCGASAIAFDAAGNLYVSSFQSGLVLEFDAPLVSDTIADRIVAGRSPSARTPSGCLPVDAAILCAPSGLAFDAAGTLYVGDATGRVLLYDSPLAGDAVADRVVGRADFSGGSCFGTIGCRDLRGVSDLAFDANANLHVLDGRIIRFDSPLTTDFVADAVLGQPDFDTFAENFLDDRGLSEPQGVAVDRSSSPNRVFVADSANARILGWSDASALANGAPADLALGAPDFFHSRGCTGTPSVPGDLCSPGALAVDTAGNLYVADPVLNLVVGFRSPFTTDDAPDIVLGTPVPPGASCTPAEVGSATLCSPTSLASSPDGRLFVVEDGLRIAVFDDPFTTDEEADAILLPTSDCPPGNGPCRQTTVATDHDGNLYVSGFTGARRYDAPTVEDDQADAFYAGATGEMSIAPDGTLFAFNAERVLVFDDALTSDTVADGIIGSAESSCVFGGVDADSFCHPSSLGTDAEGNLYIADAGNHRVLIFDQPLGRPIGDGGGLAADTVGLHDFRSGAFFLRNLHQPGPADLTYFYGPAGSPWIPISGDWNGDGVSTVGLYNSNNGATGAFFLRDRHEPGPADVAFEFGRSDPLWIPLAGDWDGDGADSIGIYDPASATIFLRNQNSAGVGDVAFRYGPPNALFTPIVGDWDGDGIDSIGLYDAANGVFFLRNSNDNGVADLTFQYGPRGAVLVPVAGDWDGDGVDTIGLYDRERGLVALRNGNDAGFADLVYGFGPGDSSLTIVTGNWDGL